MAFSRKGKRTQRTGYIQTKHIYLYNTYAGKAMKHVCSKTIMHVCKVTKAITGRGQRHKQGKALRPNIIIISQALNRFYLSDSAPQDSLKRKEKATLIDESGRQGPWTFIVREPWLTEWAHETDAVYLHLVVRRWAGRDVCSPRPLGQPRLIAALPRRGDPGPGRQRGLRGTNGSFHALSELMLYKS